MYLNTRLYNVRGLGPREHKSMLSCLMGEASTQNRGSQPSTSRSRVSQSSTSRGYVSLAYEALKAYEANQEEPVVDADAPINSYPEDSFETLLLHLYRDNVARHV